MRRPTSWSDRGLLGEEPFLTSFLACAAADAGRQASREIEHRMKIIATEELNRVKGGREAARSWLKAAFAKSPNEPKKVKIELTQDMRLVFVKFYWKMYSNDDHIQYLFQERKNRGYESMPDPSHIVGWTSSKDSLRSSSSRHRTKKTAAPSHRASLPAKKQALCQKPIPVSDVKKPKRKLHRHGFEGPESILFYKKSRQSTPTNTMDINEPRASRRSKAPPILKTRSTPAPTSTQVQGVVASSAQPSSFPIDAPPRSLCVEVVPVLEAPTSSAVNQSSEQDSRWSLIQSTLSSSDNQTVQSMQKYERGIPISGPPTLKPAERGTWGHSVPPITPSPGISLLSPENRPTILSKATPILLPDVGPRNRELFYSPPEMSNLLMRLPELAATMTETLTDLDMNTLIAIGPELADGMKLYTTGQDPSHHATVQIPQYKPPLSKLPPIWAQSRQEVCESFEWFRSYQGGVYYSRNVVKGYLLSAFCSCRDRYLHDGRLIISHGGGRAESVHSRQGQSVTQPAEDQLAQDKSVRALLSNYRQSRPLVLLIDDKYALFPYDLGASDVTYAVLGFYTITHAWAEHQPTNNDRGYVVRYKFSFQWCDGQGEPWWVADQAHDMEIDEPMDAIPAPPSAPVSFPEPLKIQEYNMVDIAPSKPDDVYSICHHCLEKTPQVYQDGWACLNATCDRFWITHGGYFLPNSPHLRYNEQFTRLSTLYRLPHNLRDLRPNPPESTPDTVNTTYAYTRGWHCRKCGRLSCRDKWEDWECANCHITKGVPGRIRSPKEFWAQKIPVSFLDHYIRKSSGIIQQPSRLFSHGRGMGQVQSFILPDGRGRIHHIQSVTPLGNLDTDKIFREYQEQASAAELKFRRWPMRSHKCRGPLLTNYFSQNSGEPYQYVGGTANTVPFSEAPSAVVNARDLIQTRIYQALEISSDFNEVLSAAYMERQKMAFHSDSEPGLGPLVAGLSMGSPALMHFRVHHKHQRKEEIERKVIVMTFVLRHGDVLVMDGHGVQDYYEHTVVPTNFRIAATARRISPPHR
ncbi:hypothetical protein Hypma_007651 [Hypsizygus marmoreus]|uniref:Alpha-ketoglutarate-dependent dioxygenase AlkB-like domain-containing protein n=1 Tax=Hypsizygus marmoreus TaxID=39966 RepID=A0A369JTQ4_HYPMA|nr:hypothetical protein Hypma_007651 [Hypsizygus marmoreus]